MLQSGSKLPNASKEEEKKSFYNEQAVPELRTTVHNEGTYQLSFHARILTIRS
jgi:hypothetical protein